MDQIAGTYFIYHSVEIEPIIQLRGSSSMVILEHFQSTEQESVVHFFIRILHFVRGHLIRFEHYLVEFICFTDFFPHFASYYPTLRDGLRTAHACCIALHWLQENVAEFGGDPTSVTLMGHGTGAACATFLMTSPAVLDGKSIEANSLGSLS